MFALIDALGDQIWSRYELAIQDERRRQLEPGHDGDDASAPQHDISNPDTRSTSAAVPRDLTPDRPSAESGRIYAAAGVHTDQTERYRWNPLRQASQLREPPARRLAGRPPLDGEPIV